MREGMEPGVAASRPAVKNAQVTLSLASPRRLEPYAVSRSITRFELRLSLLERRALPASNRRGGYMVGLPGKSGSPVAWDTRAVGAFDRLADAEIGVI